MSRGHSILESPTTRGRGLGHGHGLAHRLAHRRARHRAQSDGRSRGLARRRARHWNRRLPDARPRHPEARATHATPARTWPVGPRAPKRPRCRVTVARPTNWAVASSMAAGATVGCHPEVATAALTRRQTPLAFGDAPRPFAPRGPSAAARALGSFVRCLVVPRRSERVSTTREREREREREKREREMRQASK